MGDGLHDFSQLLKVRRIAEQESPRRARVGEDGGERLVQLVGQRNRELAGDRHARQVRQVALLLVNLQFGRLARRDVDFDSRDAKGAAVGVEGGGALRVNPSNPAVRKENAEFHVNAASGQAVGGGGGEQRAVVGVNQLLECLDAHRDVQRHFVHPTRDVRPREATGGEVPFPASELRGIDGDRELLLARGACLRLGPRPFTNHRRQEHHRDPRHGQEQLNRQRVVSRRARHERPVASTCAPNRDERADQHRGAATPRSKPDGDRNEQRQRRVRSAGDVPGPGKGADRTPTSRPGRARRGRCPLRDTFAAGSF